MDFDFPYHGLHFVWDVEKASMNLRKHNLRFESACHVFLDPLIQIEDAGDGLATSPEERFAAIGFAQNRKLLFVVHLVREKEVIRILSAREATAQERKRYEDNE